MSCPLPSLPFRPLVVVLSPVVDVLVHLEDGLEADLDLLGVLVPHGSARVDPHLLVFFSRMEFFRPR